MADLTADLADAILGTVENGPWVLIPDPALRRIVGEYVADTCHTVALAARLDGVAERVHDRLPTRLATGLPGQVAADVRERLARHLWLQSRPDDPYAQPHWDFGGDQHVNKNDWRRRADELLAVITGRSV